MIEDAPEAARQPARTENLCRESSFPLSPLQKGMFVQSLAGLRPGLNIIQVICEMREDLDVPAFSRAWRELVSRHEVFRTSFDLSDDGEPRQSVNASAGPFLSNLDLTNLTTEERKAALEEFLERDRRRGFDLRNCPSMRVSILKEEDKLLRFVWTVHHILLDARSLFLALDEVFALYEAFREGRQPSLSPAPSFRKHVEWHEMQDWARAEAFWRATLEGFQAPTPLIHTRQVRTFCDKQDFWASRQIQLGSSARESLGTLAEMAGVTLNTVFQGAWAILLSRYSGESDIVFGATRACRKSSVANSESTIGLFVNTVPVRARISGKDKVSSLLRELRNQWVAMRPFEHAPLARVEAWSEVRREERLFSTLINFQDPSLDSAMVRGGNWVNRHFSVRNQSEYPLGLAIYGNEGFLLEIMYDPTLFDEASIARMLAHLLTLLEGMAADPDIPIDRLRLLTTEESDQIVAEWNQTAAPYPAERCVHQEFERHAGLQPDAMAVMSDGGALSYGELNHRSGRFAEYLRREGVGVGSRVALCMDRSLEMIIGMLAILKAGGVYVPLDPGYPAERLAFLLNEVAAPVILTVAEVQASLPPTDAKVICLDRDWPLIEGVRIPISTGAASEARSTDLAYVIFTSGSTGVPKGVAVPHCAITRLVLNTNYVELGPTDRIAHLSNVCFDAATFEIWGALLTGASVVLIPKAVALDPDRFGVELEERQISTLFVTTALFNELAAANGRIFESVKQVLFGGEAVNPESVRRVLESGGPPRRLLHVYGPTECTTFATFYLVTEVEKDATTIPIGRPITNTTAYVLDKHGNPLPIGVPGELYLGGPGVAQGYLNQPELTAERFVADPFTEGGRLYQTGDIVKYLPDGNIEFIGRADNQVKIRGFRIEPGEIEAVLCQHPSVTAAIAIVREDDKGDKRLVAYLAADGSEVPPKPAELREFLHQRLPDYMVPSTFLVLEKLPLTATGKIDRRALPEPVLERESAGFVAPRSETEKAVAEAWSEVLNVQTIGVHDDFFQLGGHSLLATRIVSRLRNLFRIDISPRVFFENATVAAIAAYIDGAQLTAIEPTVAPLIEREEVVI